VELTTVKQKAISADRLGKFYLMGELPFLISDFGGQA